MGSNKIKSLKVKLEDTFSNNPWCVDDASAFLKFCCPECDYQIPDLQMFSDHALENHSKSLALFGTAEREAEETFIKKENLEMECSDEIQPEDFSSYLQEVDNLYEYPDQAKITL